MRETLWINGKDAYATWGVTLDSSALSALMTPAPAKPFVENKSSAEDGKQVLGIAPGEQAYHRARVDSRELSLSLNITAVSETQFLEQYALFCRELQGGVLRIRTRYQPGVTYTMLYVSCSQFTQFRRGVGRFTLRLDEPNPLDRG